MTAAKPWSLEKDLKKGLKKGMAKGAFW